MELSRDEPRYPPRGRRPGVHVDEAARAPRRHGPRARDRDRGCGGLRPASDPDRSGVVRLPAVRDPRVRALCRRGPAPARGGAARLDVARLFRVGRGLARIHARARLEDHRDHRARSLLARRVRSGADAGPPLGAHELAPACSLDRAVLCPCRRHLCCGARRGPRGVHRRIRHPEAGAAVVLSDGAQGHPAVPAPPRLAGGSEPRLGLPGLHEPVAAGGARVGDAPTRAHRLRSCAHRVGADPQRRLGRDGAPRRARDSLVLPRSVRDLERRPDRRPRVRAPALPRVLGRVRGGSCRVRLAHRALRAPAAPGACVRCVRLVRARRRDLGAELQVGNAGGAVARRDGEVAREGSSVRRPG